jgi:hypothetical protein
MPLNKYGVFKAMSEIVLLQKNVLGFGTPAPTGVMNKFVQLFPAAHSHSQFLL